MAKVILYDELIEEIKNLQPYMDYYETAEYDDVPYEIEDAVSKPDVIDIIKELSFEVEFDVAPLTGREHSYSTEVQ